MASLFFNNYHEELGRANINYTSHTFKFMLVDTVPNQDTAAFLSDVTANEVSGANYTAGGKTVTGLTWTQDNTGNRAVLDFDNFTWTNVTLTGVIGGILYRDTGVAATSPLIAYIEFPEGAQNVVANDFTVTFNASGVLTNG